MGGGEILKKGWLVKSPPLEGGGMKSWRKRFFLLRSSKILEYYKCENGDIKGVVNLEDCVSVHADLFHKKYKHVFDIQTRDRTYYLVAPSADEMNIWVTALCKLCEFTTQEVSRPSRSSSTLPGNFSVIKTPLPQPPPPLSTSKGFSPEMEKYLLSPKMVELLRCKPTESNPSSEGLYQEPSIQKGYGNHSRTLSHPNTSRTSTGSSIESSIMSRRSSEDPEMFSTRFSSSSIDGNGQIDPTMFTYNTPTNNQLVSHTHSVPSHYDVPRSSNERAQLLSNNYMVPRIARMSDPLYNYDYLPPRRPASDQHPHYDYLPKRDLQPRTDIPLPPRTDIPRPKSDIPLTSRQDIIDSNIIYDVPPHPRPLLTNISPAHSSSKRESIDSVDCPIEQDSNILQGNVPPPPIIFRRESKGNEEMIPNKLYEMVWSNQQFEFDNGDREDLEETLTINNTNDDEGTTLQCDEGTTLQCDEGTTGGTTHQYVNLCVVEEEDVPPPIDRSLKPGVPPKIDRTKKPIKAANNDVSAAVVVVNNEEVFSPREIPRLTSHSVHYTQVSFDRKKPVPTPRANNTPTASPQRRVNYCHIDIDATNNITLNELQFNDSFDQED